MGRYMKKINSLFNAAGRHKNSVSFFLGTTAALGFAPLFLWPLTLLSLAYLWFLYNQLLDLTPSRNRLWKAALFGWSFGLGYFVVGLYWITNALFVDLNAFWWGIPFSFIGLPAILAIFIAVPFILTALFPREGLARILLFAASWVALEWIRGHIFTGFPWNFLGYIWGWSSTMSQTASLAGIYGLSLLTVFMGISLGSLRKRKVVCLITYGIVCLCWGGGHYRVTHPDVVSGPSFAIRLVQPNVSQTLKWDPAEKKRNFHHLLTLSTFPSSLPLKAIIWPESAVSFFLDGSPSARRVIGDSLPRGALLFTGGLRRTPLGARTLKIWNSLLVVDEKGSLIAHFDKSHLVPFGEYFPFRETLDKFLGKNTLKKITAGDRDFTPGEGPQSIPLPEGFPSFSGLVCYEVIFPGAIIHPTHPRPGWIINVTNDAWYGNSSGPYQHLESARFRAIEEGIPLVRVANSGVSAVFDAYGQIVGELPLNTESILDVILPRPTCIVPPYARWGDNLIWALICGLLLWSWSLRRK
jgi:apolipoprotein N-acyltransferase